MLRVGLTGSLGSGKSTAARIFATHGAHILESDIIGRDLMQPGQAAYAAIVAHFGPAVVLPDDTLDRPALARIAFTEGRVEELNAIVHPLVIAEQTTLANAIFERDPAAIVISESALIFETKYGEVKHGETKHGEAGHPNRSRNDTPSAETSKPQPWRTRFDRLILVTAPEELKVARFITRASAGQPLTPGRRAELEAEAHKRLAQQIPDEQKSALCDYILINNGPLPELEWQIDRLWPILQAASSANSDPV